MKETTENFNYISAEYCFMANNSSNLQPHVMDSVKFIIQVFPLLYSVFVICYLVDLIHQLFPHTVEPFVPA